MTGLHLVGQWCWKVREGWEIEAEVAAAEHGGDNAGLDGLWLDVQGEVDFVRAPPPDKADAIVANTATEQGHSAAGASAVGGEILGIQVEEEGHSLPENDSDTRGKDELPRVVGRPEGVDG